jgi:hypothetical protein
MNMSSQKITVHAHSLAICTTQITYGYHKKAFDIGRDMTRRDNLSLSYEVGGGVEGVLICEMGGDNV